MVLFTVLTHTTDRVLQPGGSDGHTALWAVVVYYTAFDLYSELRQMIAQGSRYPSWWNALDVTGLGCVMVTLWLMATERDAVGESDFETVGATAVMLVYLRCLHFMRGYETTGTLVRTLASIVYGMKVRPPVCA